VRSRCPSNSRTSTPCQSRAQGRRGHRSDIARSDERHRQVGSKAVAENSLRLQQREHRKAVFEKRRGAQQQQVRIGNLPQPLFLRVQTGDHAAARFEICTEAAERHDVTHAAAPDRGLDALPNSMLLGAVIRNVRVCGDERVDRVGASKSFREERGIGGVAHRDFGAGLPKLREFAGRAADEAHVFAGFLQEASDFAAGLTGGSENGDHE
jgi:hypothetical protein